MRLRFTRRALAQIQEIRTYVEADDPTAAEAIVRRIETVAQLIARHPTIGRPTTMKRVRVFSVLPYPYLLFYQTNEQSGEVTVVRIRHTARRQNWRDGR